MWPFTRKENRAEGSATDALIQALLQGTKATKDRALQIPTIAGAIDLIANVVASTPIRLYRDEGGKAVEVKNDRRVFLLNDETGDALNANEFWHAMIRDYYLGRGGYAYLDYDGYRELQSIRYVDESHITIIKNTDPIFKDFNICVDGQVFYPWDFLKILRNTKDGAEGYPITTENSRLIEAMYLTLVMEYTMAARGGNKRGFLKSERKLAQEQLDALKRDFRKLYSSDDVESFMLLNQGLDFKEISDTAVEMQLNENKITNAAELAKVFHISTDVMGGKCDAKGVEGLAKLAAIPLMTVIQCALNRDLLLEDEKHGNSPLYFAFDTKELLKGDMKERFDAYKVALDSNFMQIDEVRYQENMPPLGLSWIKLGLQDVLYDPKNKMIYTPNTGELSAMSANQLKTKKEETPEE
jgi:HK97 family phage portal protein|nr:MAG TPA_asm: portal protein [Caudoviricetes sp.]